MADDIARRYQVLDGIGYCTACGSTVTAPDGELEDEAATHARDTGHEVRVTRTRLIIISPQPAEARAPADCGCPVEPGMIRHLRRICTDPVVARLGWYADDAEVPR